jgi:hypothetical protein
MSVCQLNGRGKERSRYLKNNANEGIVLEGKGKEKKYWKGWGAEGGCVRYNIGERVEKEYWKMGEEMMGYWKEFRGRNMGKRVREEEEE